MLYPLGGQTDYIIQTGQFIELEISLSNNGCYIQSDKPVEVCTYLTSGTYNGNTTSDPSQAWLSSIKQTTPNALIAPFNIGGTYITDHRAILITPTATKINTKVSIGGSLPMDLSNGSWYDNDTAGISFYIMPLTNSSASYYFINEAGLIVMCYGVGPGASYYYLASSAMRDLDAAFYVNDIHFQDLPDTIFCTKVVNFRAEIESELHTDSESLKWYIDEVAEVLAQDNLEWNKTFSPGEYEIRMWVRYENNDTVSKTGFLKIISCEQNAEFYANNVQSQNLKDTTFCAKDVYFQAEIEGLHEDAGSLKWFIDGVEYELAQDQMQWNKPFGSGEYEIEMQVRYENEETETVSGTLKMDVLWIKIRNVRN
jgi:hypothetical protein